MKLYFSFVFIICASCLNNTFAQGLGINDSGLPADASAIIDVNADNMGLLIPRMSTIERNAINKPAQALMIYNITTKCYEYWEYSQWQSLACVSNLVCGTSNVSFNYNGNNVTYGTVYSPVTGKCWLDRNLGATQVATSHDHSDAYGDLIQWGRLIDGHQIKTSQTTMALSGFDIPGHSKFISVSIPPYDWRSPQNDNLWQGVTGVNNPCPSGWRLPTENEMDNERISWQPQTHIGAFQSPLKLPAACYRGPNGGLCNSFGIDGSYWTSTTKLSQVSGLDFDNTHTAIFNYSRAFGFSVRCILD